MTLKSIYTTVPSFINIGFKLCLWDYVEDGREVCLLGFYLGMSEHTGPSRKNGVF